VSITGVVSITHVYEVALPFPAASIAWTTKVCEPTPRPEYVFGLVQEGFEPLSSRQWNLTPASLSEKLKLAVVAFVGLAGLLPIVGAGGGVVSTVHECDVTVLSFRSGSTAFTPNVCGPSPRPE
jgi:hypothetical protein